MARILETSSQEFITTIINMLKALTDKIDSVQEQMDNVSKDIEILRKNQKETPD